MKNSSRHFKVESKNANYKQDMQMTTTLFSSFKIQTLALVDIRLTEWRVDRKKNDD